MLKKKITRTKRPLSAEDRAFIRAMFPYARILDLAHVIGRKLSVIQYVCKDLAGRPAARQPLSIAGLERGLELYRAGDEITDALKFWRDDFDSRGRAWTLADDQLLIDLLGTMSREIIVSRLNRDALGVRRRIVTLKAEGKLLHSEFHVAKLAEMIRTSSYQILRLCAVDKLRCYEGGARKRLYIHRDDAQALLDMPQPFDPGAVTKHPGKSRA